MNNLSYDLNFIPFCQDHICHMYGVVYSQPDFPTYTLISTSGQIYQPPLPFLEPLSQNSSYLKISTISCSGCDYVVAIQDAVSIAISTLTWALALNRWDVLANPVKIEWINRKWLYLRYVSNNISKKELLLFAQALFPCLVRIVANAITMAYTSRVPWFLLSTNLMWLLESCHYPFLYLLLNKYDWMTSY
uniref:Uncharacterized protein n=1 Tax=Acrobeloides nanus TaxID=290746 RepID=A0A914EBE6_9BILA